MTRRLLIISTVLLLFGCSSFGLKFKDTPQGNQAVANLSEAGSVHVAVIAITPWNEIKSKLRPEIAVDPKTLKSQAIPSTQAMLDRYLSILRLQASLAPTVVKNTSKAITTTETDEEDVTKTETTTERFPGTPRAPTAATALNAGAKPGSEASGITTINSSLALRAMASYKQDVEALNAEVDNAASRTGYDPYLMRIQISVMPRRRHLGYDVYSNLSMFSYKRGPGTADDKSIVRTGTDATPFVVPLLSSDSIETAERSQSIEALRELGLALDLIKGFGGLGLSANSQKDRQQALQGLNVNSILTLGRLSDNSLRIRFGAANDPGGGYVTHPRTNTISVLVFFPKNADVTRVVSKSSWQHVVDGTELQSSGESYGERIEPIVKQWSALGLDEEFLRSVDEYPLEGNYQLFENLLGKHLSSVCKRTTAMHEDIIKSCSEKTHNLMRPGFESQRERTTAYIWTHLLSVLPGGRFSTTVVDLPKEEQADCPVAGQLGLYAETETGIAVSLRGGNRLNADALKGALHWKIADVVASRPVALTVKIDGRAANATKNDASKNLSTSDSLSGLIATAIAVKDERRTVTLVFDTARMVPIDISSKRELTPSFVELSGCKATAIGQQKAEGKGLLWKEGSQVYALNAKIPLKEKDIVKDAGAGLSLSVSTDTLLLDAKNFGDKIVVVDLGEKPESQYALKFVGGDVVSVGPQDSISPRPDGSYLVKTSGPVNVRLRIPPNQSADVELRAINDKGKLGATVKKLTLNARSSKA